MKSFLKISLLLWVTFLVISCNNSTYTQGKRMYEVYCQNCHMDDGMGLAKLIPPLANADYLRDNQEMIPCIIYHGQNDTIVVNGVTFTQEMPGEKYNEVQITNIINYINTAWGNQIEPVTLDQVKERLAKCDN